jgi:hypothetical protein
MGAAGAAGSFRVRLGRAPAAPQGLEGTTAAPLSPHVRRDAPGWRIYYCTWAMHIRHSDICIRVRQLQCGDTSLRGHRPCALQQQRDRPDVSTAAVSGSLSAETAPAPAAV